MQVTRLRPTHDIYHHLFSFCLLFATSNIQDHRSVVMVKCNAVYVECRVYNPTPKKSLIRVSFWRLCRHVVLEKCVDRGLKLVSAFQKIDFENEEITNQSPSQLFNELASSCRRTTCKLLGHCSRKNYQGVQVSPDLPVAIISSTTSTDCPFFIASL